MADLHNKHSSSDTGRLDGNPGTATPTKTPQPAKVVAPTVDEMADALRAVVFEAEQSGGRDRPEVVMANALLARTPEEQRKVLAENKRVAEQQQAQ